MSVNFSRSYLIGLISILIASLITGALSIQTIYQATQISEPVQITLLNPESDLTNKIQVTRLSRGGAQFTVPAVNPNTWETKEWVRAIEIHYPYLPDTAALMFSMKVGEQTYPLIPHDTILNTEKNTAIQMYSISQENLGQQAALMPFFSKILNWPGDITAIWKAVYLNLSWFIICFFSSYLILLLYARHLKSIRSEATEEELKRSLKLSTPVFAIILSTASILLFIHSGPTAYEWPTLDMGPFFERYNDPNVLTNDFFTNVSSEPNPRFIFGYIIIGIQTLLQISWYESLFLVKTLLITLLPPLLFLSLRSFFYRFSIRQQLTINIGLFIFIFAALFPFWIDQFTVALWRPFVTTVTPHALAFAFGLLAMLITNSSRHLVSLPFWFLSSLLHPTVGISLFTFFVIIRFRTLPWRQFISIFIFGVILPFLILAIIFNPTNPLSGEEFIYHYIITNHTIHYLPSAFESSPLSPFPWYFHFTLLNLLFASAFLFGWLKRDKFITTTAAFALITYTSSIIACYLFIELWPVKLIGVIGPSRYTMLGYWFFALLAAVALTHVPYRYLLIDTLFKPLRHLKSAHLWKYGTVIICITIVGIYNNYLDDPKTKWLETHSSLSTWISTTDEKTVFATNTYAFFDYAFNIPLVTHRAIFSGNGFPFREDEFKAFDERRSLLFGTPVDWKEIDGGSTHIKSNVFFRRLTPTDFANISHQYQLDYVIIEPTFSEAFSEYTPVYSDTIMRIYKVSDFTI